MGTGGCRDLLVLPQKSGMAYALDPDKQGALVWQHRFGQGSGRGGQWGGAIDDRQTYFRVADSTRSTPGGMVALSVSYDGGLRAYAADDGTVLWQFDTNREFTTVNG